VTFPSLNIQLWSYNYDPEPTGIAPLARAWALAMIGRGHHVEVVAAHPHYPDAAWGTRLRPYRERRDGVRVVRLPLWIGRETAKQRMRQEASYTACLAAASPFLRTPDVIVATSPSFPALAGVMLNARLRRTPWVLWLQDILPEGAIATGLIDPGMLIRAAMLFERAAYRSAAQVVVLSDTFRDNLRSKGVPETKLTRIYNPASRDVRNTERRATANPPVVLTMGNIGYSQNLEAMVRAFEADPELEALGARFVLAGDGVAGDEVRAAIRTDRVVVTGIVDDTRLSEELSRARVALVSQHYEGAEFNVPSKFMNFMGEGLATVASVSAGSEVARILRETGAGWITDSAQPARAMEALAAAIRDPAECERRGAAALRFAQSNLRAAQIAERFEAVLLQVTDRSVP
jgi:colanic acid biosynthesis glycosyl transferase WcaI